MTKGHNKRYRVGKPIPVSPSRQKYGHIWRQVRELVNGDWLPVTCPDATDARRLYGAALQIDFDAQLRGQSVYLRVKRADAEQHVA